MKDFFLQQIKEATTLDQLDYIVEKASEQIEDNNDYSTIYDAAMNKALRWQGGWDAS
jgi:hypothetical protein